MLPLIGRRTVGFGYLLHLQPWLLLLVLVVVVGVVLYLRRQQ